MTSSLPQRPKRKCRKSKSCFSHGSWWWIWESCTTDRESLLHTELESHWNCIRSSTLRRCWRNTSLKTSSLCLLQLIPLWHCRRMIHQQGREPGCIPVNDWKPAVRCCWHKTRHFSCSWSCFVVQLKASRSLSDCCQANLPLLKGKLGCTIKYKKSGYAQLIGYTDADYAGDLDDQHSTTGNLLLMSGGPVSWFTKKQLILTLSLLLRLSMLHWVLWHKNLPGFDDYYRTFM